ncbi:mannan endo-1,4-beta-mannosidase 5-like [Malania oleifera]|uniref:mannan endo-1,4-beta-mannosidase 5-like n=1 Tax=Malania oleifera TaxID=397392 RepID=UPI0025AE9DC8|nr:mannan endo-1,4-beta-mannosidase 5-like [Malania oleifera]
MGTSFEIRNCTLLGLLVLIASIANQCEGAEFVKCNNTHFMVGGSRFFFNGFNSYWLMDVASDPSQRSKVSNVFGDAAAAGLTVCRTWAFSDGGTRPLQKSPGAYNENFFRALDFVVSEAGKYNIRLILSLVNNWKDYGGKPQYVQWARNNKVQVKSDDDFFTNTVIQFYYKNHVKKILTRLNTITHVAYKDDSTIMAWELMNEPRCQVDASGKTLTTWTQRMASYLKSIDNKHLLEIGLEGFYGNSTPGKTQYNPQGGLFGTDFVANNQIKEIDFTTIHAYPNDWLPGANNSSQMAFVQRWMTIHSMDSNAILKKPLVFAEFGKSKKEAGYNTHMRDSYLSAIYTTIYKDASKGGPMAGGLVWQLMAKGMESYYDGYEIVLQKNTSTTAIITQQSTKMNKLMHK